MLSISLNPINAQTSGFQRGDKVLDDDFENFEEWIPLNLGTVSQFTDSANAVSLDNVARKTGSGDPNGAIKQMSKSVDDFEMVLYSKKGDDTGGDLLRYSITKDLTGNGYGFFLTPSILSIEKRDGSFVSTEIQRSNHGWNLGEWNTFRFIKDGRILTLEYYKNQIVDVNNFDNETPTGIITTLDNSFSNGFNYVAINGGSEFDTDDISVWEINEQDRIVDWNLLLNIPPVIQSIIAGDYLLPWNNISDKPQTLGDLDCATDQIAKYDGAEWMCSNDEFGLEIIRIDGGRMTDINTVEVYFLDGDGVTRNNPSDFELASKMVGVDGIISEVQYKIGKSNPSGETVTARIYKNNVEVGSCNLVTSTISHSSCTMTLSESVVKDDLIAMSDITSAQFRILVEGKSAFVEISIP